MAEYARLRRQPKAKPKPKVEPGKLAGQRPRHFKDFAAEAAKRQPTAAGADVAPEPGLADFLQVLDGEAVVGSPQTARRSASPRPGRPFAERRPEAPPPSLDDMLAQIEAADEAGDVPADSLAIVPVQSREDSALRSLDRVFSAQSGRHPIELHPSLRDCSGGRLLTMTGFNNGILDSSGTQMLTLEERCARSYNKPTPKPQRAKRSTGAAMMPKALQIAAAPARPGILSLDLQPSALGEAMMPLALPGLVFHQPWSQKALPPPSYQPRPDHVGARLPLPAPSVEVPRAEQKTSPPAVKDFGAGLKGGFLNAPKKKKSKAQADAAALAEIESVDALLARLDREADAF